MSASLSGQHSEWLSLVEISGPFLTLPVLKRALPLGLDPTPLALVDDLRVAWNEVSDDGSLTPRWIRWVLHDLLELPGEVIKEGPEIGPALTYTVPEHGVKLRPDFAIVDPDRADEGSPARMLVITLPAGTKLDERLVESKWSADAVDRMAELCRGSGVRLGLVTNGEYWAVVDAPVGGATGVAMWDASLWLEERLTLDAFTTLLGVRRFFSVADADTLDAMLSESANAEAEVTDQLGKQVRAAVELLVDAMSHTNRDSGGHLFDDVSTAEVYEAAVTVMMRLVFLLSAEERGLFLLGDETYDSTYAVSTLRAQLEEEANTYGEEVIARRTDAWHRLLATFRMVFGGAQHENLRLPAYGGSLFDPDRFPFLEGRKAGHPWRTTASIPLPIDNRTMLHILGALQILTFKDRRGVKEARRLSFRALDVEQIGHVYEGLLDHSAIHVDEVAVGLGGKNEPEIALELIEAKAERGPTQLLAYLVELTGLSAKVVEKALAAVPDPHDLERLTSACENDRAIADRIAPYLGLLRLDLTELPVVYLPNSIYVTQSSDRRTSGAYYTPRNLAEEIVRYSLEALVYAPGPSEETEPSAWKLKSSIELLDLKVCDLAMGSGAFLVATCRYVSARLLEAWESEGFSPGDPVPLSGGRSVVLPIEDSDREILARRLVADSCLYGVDRNPMAVEMAKLSMWLITLAKDRPFTFVDHALRCGDSLLGVTDLRQLDCLHLDPDAGRRLHGGSLFDPVRSVEPLVRAALEKRRQLEASPVMDVHDAEFKRALFDESNALMDRLKVIGNILVGAALSTSAQSRDAFESRLLAVAPEVAAALDPDKQEDDAQQRLVDLQLKAEYWLDEGRPPMAPDRCCLHWPLEFPEVFLDGQRTGFDAIVGNPPFLSGTDLTPVLGTSFRAHLVERVAKGIRGVRGQADLCVYFLLRATDLSRQIVGLVTTNSVADGDSQEVGTAQLLETGRWSLIRVVSSLKWPSAAQVHVSMLWMTRNWNGTRWLDNLPVSQIRADFNVGNGIAQWTAKPIPHSFVQYPGSKVNGVGFYLDNDEVDRIREQFQAEMMCIRPLVIGEDLTESPTQSPGASIIFFGDLTLEEAARYPHLLSIVEERVRKPREAKGSAGWRKRMVERWWQYEAVRAELYSAIASLERVVAITRTSNTCVPVLISPNSVFTEGVIIFATESYSDFGVLTSCFHIEWAFNYGSAMKTDLRYVATRCFETLPFPVFESSTLADQVAGKARELHRYRGQLMCDANQGLTKLYNQINNSHNATDEIVTLRRLHAELDGLVAAAYGWRDLDLGHGFHESRHGLRYSVQPEAREEILGRLLQMNKKRFELMSGETKDRGRRPRRRSGGNADQLTLDNV